MEQFDAPAGLYDMKANANETWKNSLDGLGGVISSFFFFFAKVRCSEVSVTCIRDSH